MTLLSDVVEEEVNCDFALQRCVRKEQLMLLVEKESSAVDNPAQQNTIILSTRSHIRLFDEPSLALMVLCTPYVENFRAFGFM
jgi:hypothetical protein